MQFSYIEKFSNKIGANNEQEGIVNFDNKNKRITICRKTIWKTRIIWRKESVKCRIISYNNKIWNQRRTSVQLAQKILKLNENAKEDNLNFLRNISIEELMQIKGIGKVKAIQLKAVCELGVRMSKPSNYKKIKIKSPADIAKILMNELRYEKKEIVKLIILNNKNEIQKILNVAIGGSNFANFCVTEI